jgi:hypothetical protein
MYITVQDPLNGHERGASDEPAAQVTAASVEAKQRIADPTCLQRHQEDSAVR